MKPPPYDLVYQDGCWAIVDVSDYVKYEHRKADIHPSYPWIMHWCKDEVRYWSFACDAPPMPSVVRGLFCRECKEIPPDHILTIHELYK